jgi:hypothetical protein
MFTQVRILASAHMCTISPSTNTTAAIIEIYLRTHPRTHARSPGESWPTCSLEHPPYSRATARLKYTRDGCETTSYIRPVRIAMHKVCTCALRMPAFECGTWLTGDAPTVCSDERLCALTSKLRSSRRNTVCGIVPLLSSEPCILAKLHYAAIIRQSCFKPRACLQ